MNKSNYSYTEFLEETVDLTQSIHAHIIKQATKQPNKTAIIDQSECKSYEQLLSKSVDIANEILSRDIQPGALVGVCMNRSWELIATVLGILQSGCAYVPLDPKYPRERIRFMLQHSKAAAVVVDDTITSELCKGFQLINKNSLSQARPLELPTVSSTSLAYVIYTSGSTGQPKGVAIEHRNVLAMINAMNEILEEKDLEGMLAATSICFDPSVSEILGTLALGGSVILAKNMLDLPELDKKGLIKSCIVVPSAIQALLSSGWKPLGIRTIIFGSEALKQPLVEKLLSLNTGTRMFNAYGPTEDTVFSTCTEILDATQPVTIGQSVPYSNSYILNEEMTPVKSGEAGELYLAGSKLARGYLFDESKTDERFIQNKSKHITESRIYKTGDLCRRLENGNIEFLGRIDQQVKVKGFRIELKEIESVLESKEGVITAAALVTDGLHEQQVLTAFVTCSDLHTSTDCLKSHLSDRLPKYMIPQVIHITDSLPLLPNGKVDRNQLVHLSKNSHKMTPASIKTNKDITFDQSAILEVIQNATASLLGYKDSSEIAKDLSFESMGIDSLASVELSSRLAKALNIPLPVNIILEYPTADELAHYIINMNSKDNNPLRSKQKSSNSLATFQTQIQSSHPTFQAAKINAWSVNDKSKLVQEVLHMVNNQRRNPYSKVLRTGSATHGLVSDAYSDEEQDAIIWTTNLYLGLNRDKEVIQESSKALHSFGTGMGTSAAASGMTDLHLSFEKEFATLTGKPSACLFPTGYTANLGAVAGILNHNDVVVIDQLCHASIVDGARLSGASIRTFKHNNVADLEEILKTEVSPYRTTLVVLEGVYSMGEGAAPVADIVRMAKKYDALVLVDEAHSFGFYGEGGAGICAAQGITEDVDFIMTTLSKALGSIGGVVSASQEHIDLIKSSSRAYIFQASISPADMAAALTALRRLRADDALRERLWNTTQYMRMRFTEEGYDLGTGDGPIVTPHFRNKDKLYGLVQEMYKRGVQTSAVTYPIVEPGRGRLRLICSAAHTFEDVDKTLKVLKEAEEVVDHQLKMSHNHHRKAKHMAQADLDKWASRFVEYLNSAVFTSQSLIPDLLISIKTLKASTPLNIVIDNGIAQMKSEHTDNVAKAVLLFKDDDALHALYRLSIQEILLSISQGTCVLEGDVEPFTWFMARIKGLHDNSLASKTNEFNETEALA